MKSIIIGLIISISICTASALVHSDNNYPYWQNIKKSFKVMLD